MPRSGEHQDKTPLQDEPRRGRWTPMFPRELILFQVVALLLLAIGTVWLLQRGTRLHEAAEQTAQERSLTELVALAAGSEVSFQDSARLLRILECAARKGDLLAGAVLDSTGTVIAHTDMTQAGLQLDELTFQAGSLATSNETLKASLFSSLEGQGRVFAHPLVAAGGPVGTVALLLPDTRKSILDAEVLKLLLPAVLLLLAFVGLTRITIRHAIKPTSDFLERLTTSLKDQGEPHNPKGFPTKEYDRLMDEAVSCVSALGDAKETLTIANRVLDFERKRKGLILDHLPDALIMTDAVDKVAFMNRAAAIMTDRASDETVGQEIKTLPDSFVQLLSDAQKTGQAIQTIRKGDMEQQILLTRIPVGGAHGQTAGTLYVLRDVTAQQAALQAQGEFLSQISHELKAPLNSILTYVEALADDDLLSQDERREFSNTLSAEAHRMSQLIANLLQLSRIQLGNLNAKFGFVKPASLITGLAETLRAQAERRGLTFDVHVAENLPPLYGDKDLLGVALTNLITNAIKYTPRGGRISVRASAEAGDLSIEVEDTGIGIPEKDRSRIFERFVRSDQPAVQEQSGTGLGLSLVKEIAEIHEGHLTVESNPDHGSLFGLRLPSREVGSRLDMGAA